MLGSVAVSGPRANAKIAPALTQSSFVARVLTQQFVVARYYFVISAHFLTLSGQLSHICDGAKWSKFICKSHIMY